MPKVKRRAARAAVKSRSTSRIESENDENGGETAEATGKKIHLNKIREGKKLINGVSTL